MRISIALRYILKRSLQGAISSRAALSPISAANLDFLPDPAKSASVLSGPWSRQFRPRQLVKGFALLNVQPRRGTVLFGPPACTYRCSRLDRPHRTSLRVEQRSEEHTSELQSLMRI